MKIFDSCSLISIMNLMKIENPFGGLTYYKESTTNTMVEAKALLSEPDIHGSIFVSDFQTAGMGRVPGRIWDSESGKNLTFTLILDKNKIGHDFGMLPLKAGLALAKTVDDLSGIEAKVKWPNDVVVHGNKISGVLCQSNSNYVLVGIGLNINQLEFGSNITQNTTSLSLLTQNGFSLEMVLSLVLNKLHTILNSSNWLEDLNSSLYKRGENVSFLVGNPANNNLITGELIYICYRRIC
ncbi:MAG: biotin--[acetyl-CoA-carboxylase] ligase [Spirochaetaceae bacterium 4572_7]|nr:MAG: biotin--[acetyl-CoA-carboxylase] ligase [Spirochaetaceae bacterium 4572_7]